MAASDAGGVVAAWSEAWRGGATDLAVSVQYATLQQAWGAATHGVRAQARAQAEAARRLGAEIVKPLQVAVRATAAQSAAALRGAEVAFGAAVAARMHGGGARRHRLHAGASPVASRQKHGWRYEWRRRGR